MARIPRSVVFKSNKDGSLRLEVDGEVVLADLTADEVISTIEHAAVALLASRARQREAARDEEIAALRAKLATG